MAKKSFGTVLVIGDNHEEIAKKYSLSTKVEPYVFMRRDEAETKQKAHLSLIESILNSKEIKLNNVEREAYKNQYLDIKDMSDFDYYLYITDGCRYDEENGDALSDKNPNAHYQYEKCYQKSLLKYGTEGEGTFSNPFKMKDGTMSYSARKGDIDWTLNHMHNTEIYEAAWDIVVNGLEPTTEQERIIKNNMSNRKEYFKNFKSKDEYVKHSCSFWCYGVATDEKYEDMDDYKTRNIRWIDDFYDNFIKDLPYDTLLTIYEVKFL